MFVKNARYICVIKGAQSYFSKISFLFYLKDHHTKDVNFKCQLNQSSHLDVGSNFIAVAYIIMCKLNYGYHNQARFH